MLVLTEDIGTQQKAGLELAEILSHINIFYKRKHNICRYQSKPPQTMMEFKIWKHLMMLFLWPVPLQRQAKKNVNIFENIVSILTAVTKKSTYLGLDGGYWSTSTSDSRTSRNPDVFVPQKWGSLINIFSSTYTS